jgi:hypothetical protein
MKFPTPSPVSTASIICIHENHTQALTFYMLKRNSEGLEKEADIMNCVAYGVFE